MKAKGPKDGFREKDAGEGNYPLKVDHGTMKVPPNSSRTGRVLGPESNATKLKSKAGGIEHKGTVIGSLPKPPMASPKSINRLPSGGKTRIV